MLSSLQRDLQLLAWNLMKLLPLLPHHHHHHYPFSDTKPLTYILSSHSKIFSGSTGSKVMENKMMETNNATADFHSYGKIKNNHPWNQQGNNTSSGGAYEDDCANGFSWPPRSYRCSFCKRDFRSAQALGGHMNVHRRDRARLRQSPPPPPPRDVGKCPILNLNLSPNPSPSPNFSAPSLFSTRTSPNTWSLPSMVSPSHSSSPLPPGELKKWNGGTIFVDHFSPITSDLGKEKIGKSVLGIKKFDALAGEDECKILKKAEIVRLELGIGFANYSDEVDLELRLGFA